MAGQLSDGGHRSRRLDDCRLAHRGRKLGHGDCASAWGLGDQRKRREHAGVAHRRCDTTSIVIASLLFGYNAAVTSLYVEPDYRYREMVDLQAIVLAGLGLVAIRHWLRLAFGQTLASPFAKVRSEVRPSIIRSVDFWRGLE